MAGSKVIYIFVAFFLAAISIAIRHFPLSKETKISLGYSEKTFLNFTEAASKNRYVSEEHTVTTEDGYVLTIFRITKARNCHEEKKQRPVLLMHGLLENSDIFLDAGPSAGLAYLLSDSCFDTWVGNQRGNNYGRKHMTWNPDKDAEFWQFSVDEIGFYDVPASIDYILKHTGADKLNYVGFSQGCGIFFAMCSERPNYCTKMGVMIATAPAVLLVHYESLPMSFLLKSVVLLKSIFNLLGIHELFGKGELHQELLEWLCQISESRWIETLCGSGAYLDSYHSGSIAFETRRLIFSHFLVGTSVNTLVRYGQSTKSGKFQKFDYGEKINLERYNSTVVPEYNLVSVTVPVVLLQGRADKLVDLEDTKTLSTTLPNVLEMAIVPDPHWNHFDMIYSQNINTTIYPKIYEYLQKYSQHGVS